MDRELQLELFGSDSDDDMSATPAVPASEPPPAPLALPALAPAPAPAPAPAVAKRKRPLESEGDELLLQELRCPITQELPVDPVTAGDGRVYERLAVIRHFKGRDKVTSPVTGEEISPVLVPSHQMRNTIERLIERQVLAGPEADLWKKANEDFKALDPQSKEMACKAHAGDSKAMHQLGVAYRDGTRGVKKDLDKALKWLMKPAMEDDVRAVTDRAAMLIANAKPTFVVMEMTRAAMLGSAHACAQLGHWFSSGSSGNEYAAKSDLWAHYWFKRMRSASCKNAHQQYVNQVDEWYKAHGEQEMAKWLERYYASV